MTDAPDGRPDWWAPGSALPPGGGGYSLEQTRASCGPGWDSLAVRAWTAATAEGALVVQVKSKWARLTVYTTGLAWGAAAGRRLQAQLAAIEEESSRMCEACGRPGRVWADTDEECADIARATGRRWLWQYTLCPDCGYRFYYLGARGWPAIRGEWRPDDDDDDFDGEDW